MLHQAAESDALSLLQLHPPVCKEITRVPFTLFAISAELHKEDACSSRTNSSSFFWVRVDVFVWAGSQHSILEEQLSRAGKPETVFKRQHFYFCKGPTAERVYMTAC